MPTVLKKLLPKILTSTIRKCINLFFYSISWFLFFLSGKGNKEKILLLKEKHKGQRCFIIGNGPSLTSKDLDVLYQHHEITFAANRISAIFPKTNWRPAYYLVFDETLQKTLTNIMSETEAEKKIFDINSYLWTKKVKGDCTFLRSIRWRNLLKHPRFSDDVCKKIYAIATVTYVSLQVAVYMGFQEIYLVGMDNLYTFMKKQDGTIIENENKKSYFEGLDNKVKNTIGAQWEMNIAYECAKKYANKHNIKIMNATRGGYLEIFPRIDFNDLF